MDDINRIRKMAGIPYNAQLITEKEEPKPAKKKEPEPHEQYVEYVDVGEVDDIAADIVAMIEKQQLTEIALKSGMDLDEMNHEEAKGVEQAIFRVLMDRITVRLKSSYKYK